MPETIMNGCYEFNEHTILIEMTINDFPQNINWIGFIVPSKGLDKLDWQCPYMEQYLTSDGLSKLCETYDVPKTHDKPIRVAFFLYRTSDEILTTPYGDFSIKEVTDLPSRLKQIIDFNEFD